MRISMYARSGALVIAVSLGGCERGADSVATYRLDSLPTLTYTELKRIGSLDDPELGFTEIGGLDVADDGHIFVLESRNREVRHFDQGGNRVATIGRSGAGPGEFTRPSAFGSLGDTLWVFDEALRRVSWFDRTGRLLFETHGGFRHETGISGLTIQIVPATPRPDGLLDSRATTIRADVVPPEYSVPNVRFDRQGQVVDTVGWTTVPQAATVTVDSRELIVPLLRPTSPVVHHVGRDSVIFAWTASDTDGRLVVARLTEDADTSFRTVVQYTPVPLPDGVLDSLIAGPITAAPYIGLDGATVARALTEALALPATRPPVRSSYVGVDGSIWIELNSEETEGAEWLLLDPDGEMGGRLMLPGRTRVIYSSQREIWAVSLDELDVPWLLHLNVH